MAFQDRQESELFEAVAAPGFRTQGKNQLQEKKVQYSSLIMKAMGEVMVQDNQMKSLRTTDTQDVKNFSILGKTLLPVYTTVGALLWSRTIRPIDFVKFLPRDIVNTVFTEITGQITLEVMGNQDHLGAIIACADYNEDQDHGTDVVPIQYNAYSLNVLAGSFGLGGVNLLKYITGNLPYAMSNIDRQTKFIFDIHWMLPTMLRYDDPRLSKVTQTFYLFSVTPLAVVADTNVAPSAPIMIERYRPFHKHAGFDYITAES